VRDMIKKLDAQRKEADIVVIGEKGRSQMWRTVGDHITHAATDAVML
jgi:F0F1-type ATP synthase gamma subunit